MSCVILKGSKDGLTAYINSDNYETVKDELIKKIKNSISFFSGCNLSIIDNQSKLSSTCYADLEKILKDSFNINTTYQVREVSDKSEKVFQGITEGKTKFIKNSIRSGQRVAYSGNVVVIGDVNSGAEIIAAGNIVIVGVLRGIAHAGCNGNKKAVVVANVLQPSILIIADIIVRAPDEKYESPKIPEVASVKDNSIIVEPYLPNKYI
jgi:septum site-determining protein MinC